MDFITAMAATPGSNRRDDTMQIMSDLEDARLDLSFLEADFSALKTPSRAVNVFDIAGFPRWETVASNVLAFFLDPVERHQLGTLVIDSLLACLEGAPTLTGGGRAVGDVFQAQEFLGATDWIVQTEFMTDDQRRIDLYLTNDVLGLAIVIENKVDAVVNNPFRSYVTRAARDYPKVLCVVLSPTHRRAAKEDSEWVSAAMTYDELFDKLSKSLAAGRADADSRSADLLDQFIENLSERQRTMDHAREATVLDAYWSAIEGKEAHVEEYFRAITKVNEVLKARGRTLFDEISAQLGERGLLREGWFTLGMDHGWGRADGRVTIAYVAFQLVDLNCIELMLGNHPQATWKGFAVKGYRDRNRPDALYDDFHHVPLDVAWMSSDEEVIDAFIATVERLMLAHPRAKSSGLPT